MSLREKRFALIGGGHMGAALAGGLITSRRAKASMICITDVRNGVLRSLKKRLGVYVAAENRSAVKTAGVVVLCVKPQQMGAVLEDIRPVITSRHLVLSIAAGIPTEFIEKRLGKGIPVIRVMPNTPALFGAGVMVYCLGRYSSAIHERLARKILSAVGKIWKVPENLMDVVTAVSGSGPAYVFYLAENLARAGRKLGLRPDMADELAIETVYGAGRMLRESPDSASALRERVTSPGGTTEAALNCLKKAGFERIFEKAVTAAARRSRQLSKGG